MRSISFPSLEVVRGNFSLRDLERLTRLELPALRRVGRCLEFSGLNLRAICLPALEEVGELEIASTAIEVVALPALHTVRHCIKFVWNTELRTVVLGRGWTVGGFVRVSTNPKLTMITPDAASIGGGREIHDVAAKYGDDFLAESREIWTDPWGGPR